MILLRFLVLAVMINLLCFILSPLGHSEQSRGPDAEYIFFKATHLYEAAEYDAAIAEYSRIFKLGLESGPLYFNLGNCYFKKGALGKAIVNYERAKKMIPGDGDLESNYKYVKSFIQGHREAPRNWPHRIMDTLFDEVSLDGLTILLSGVYFLSLIIIVLHWYIQSIQRHWIGILSFLAGIAILISIGLYGKGIHLGREAIVLTEKAEVKFEPFDRAGTHFSLSEGMKVYVIFSKKDWMKVESSDRKVGWIKDSQVEII